MAKEQVIVTSQKYINGKLVAEEVRLVAPEIDYLRAAIWAILIVPFGFWAMFMTGMI